ncbi:peptide/nickel transport system substrate-binding protein [Roseibium hamelinense]|uniref:Peptide/nickel transport system substrate-binding protein n=1 Tax=Roseibium hamelinense TaxID=150831 RepID=A0A562T8D3_9HYPH|nr:ABC transporter substrate-binding protein [Roseibium hamelinense]MTI43740.1 ABC transporter substrate-binding protein [Roseibium hamelinense]TWI89424.1 peptide/nickel transport system substrate-binding protein [Roseibium hamelinense]
MSILKTGGLAGLALALAGIGSAWALDLKETPDVDPSLPPVAERVPDEPLVVDMEGKGRTIGTPGGTLNTLIGRSKDVRLINVWGYARLVGYDSELNLVPDILEDVEVEEGRIFTLETREGHKWSDGHPFGAEDIRYWYEDIALNENLTPSGLPPFMLSDGKPPKFEVLDETTVRFTWDTPNPLFLPELAKSRPPFIYRPAHYLKQFHEKYGDPETIKAEAAKVKARSWAPLHNKKDDMYNALNPDMPSLQPWIRTDNGSDLRFVLTRNPYYHRLDTAGQQLPYISEVIMTVADSKLIPAKAQAGETDLQARNLSFADITVLKQGEAQQGYTTALWSNSKGAEISILPNLTVADPDWRKLLRDKRFRHALSYGIDREMVNRVLFFGLGKTGNDTVLPASPLFKPEYRTKHAVYDPEKANDLLDQIGLTERNNDGVRLMENGKPLEIIIETYGESQTEADALELVSENWKDIGVKLYIKPSQRDIVRERAITGDLVMSVTPGLENGIATSEMPPTDLAPARGDLLLWHDWGDYYETKGEGGEKPDWAPAIRLMELYAAWNSSASPEERTGIWHEMLEINAEETIRIGLVAEVPQPVLINGVKNVPQTAIYGWDPGAHFGLHRMDEFYLSDTKR